MSLLAKHELEQIYKRRVWMDRICLRRNGKPFLGSIGFRNGYVYSCDPKEHREAAMNNRVAEHRWLRRWEKNR